MSHNNTLLRLVTPYMDPKTLVRFAATSRNARAMSSPERKQVNLIKRLVRRRQAIKKHLTATQGGFRGRLTGNLFNAKMNAHARSQMTPAARLQAKRDQQLLQHARAYGKYLTNRTNDSWNRFVRIHIKEGGNKNITRRAASRLYS